MSTPRGASTILAEQPVTKQPLSWADIDDDGDYGFMMKVQTLKGINDPSTPPPAGKSLSPVSRCAAANKANQLFGSSPTAISGASGTKTVVTKKKKGSPGQPATTAKSKPSALASIEKSEAAKSFVRAEMLARNLFPSFVEVTVDGTVPYSLKSTAAANLEGVSEGQLSPSSTKVGSSQYQRETSPQRDGSPIQPDTSRRAVFEPAESAAAPRPQYLSQQQIAQLPAAIAATVNINVADRSHLGRRRRAIRVVADTLVSNGGKPMCVNEVVKLTKWNKTFRPGLGCLFSFIKSLPAFFVYHHGMITLTYEEDIASTMLRTWSETDPQAAELQNMAASNAAALASQTLLRQGNH